MELIDVLDKNGSKTGSVKERNLIHTDGDWHGSSKIWILNEQGEVLIQQAYNTLR